MQYLVYSFGLWAVKNPRVSWCASTMFPVFWKVACTQPEDTMTILGSRLPGHEPDRHSVLRLGEGVASDVSTDERNWFNLFVSLPSWKLYCSIPYHSPITSFLSSLDATLRTSISKGCWAKSCIQLCGSWCMTCRVAPGPPDTLVSSWKSLDGTSVLGSHTMWG